jgi:ABC-type Fe3+/spermidine/putrescine transport system ATPase subunit
MVADIIGTMNLFPARVLGPANPGIRLEAAGLGALELPAAAPTGAEVGVAVRPEKVQLSRDPPPSGLIAVPGTVAQVAYFGDYSHVAVDAAAKVRITCYQTHRSRRDPDALAEGEACWVSWHPADCILLTE